MIKGVLYSRKVILLLKVRGRHADKGERVWHVAGSKEECGDASAVLYQSHDKPYDLCNEVIWGKYLKSY